MRRGTAVLVWPGPFPQAPAQPGLSARGSACTSRGNTEIGASSHPLYVETQRLAVWLVSFLFFFLPSHASQEVEEDLGLLSACQGIFPDNSRFCWYFRVRNGGGGVQVTAWGPGLHPRRFLNRQWEATELQLWGSSADL